MSIDAALKPLLDAITANTEAQNAVAELLKVSIAGREAAVANITKAVEGDKPKSTRAKKADAAPAAEPAAPAEPKALTIEDFMAVVAKFNTFEKTDPAWATHRDFMKAILAHFGVDKFVGVPADQFGKVLGWLDAFKANPAAKINFSEGEDDTPAEEEEDDDLGL